MTEKKPIRVWVDGCFDMLHFGHANALRQAKELGDLLIVGIHSDEEINYNKGPPVFSEEERYKMIRSIKWVDEVHEAAPYVTELETLEKHNCNFCAHGDDITVDATGKDTYHKVKAANKFKEFKRTHGVSTTDLLNRMLRVCQDDTSHMQNGECNSTKVVSDYTKGFGFLPNSLQIAQFQHCIRNPLPNEKVVYVPGSFDLFHVGHCMFLEKCRKLGSYVIVGVYSDKTVRNICGSQYPIMSLYERLLSVLSCKFVANVIICPPYKITEEMMMMLNIDVVVHGNTVCRDEQEIFEIPKSMNRYQTVDSGSHLTVELLIKRIRDNHALYEVRNKLKQDKEIARLVPGESIDSHDL